MSEFGKGLVICLVKFAEHAMRLDHFLEENKILRKKHPELFSESNGIEMWANGASDHLYEIEVPEGEDWTEIRAKVSELREKGLEMGHGFTGKKFSEDDVYHLFNLTQEIAMLVDEKIGLKPEKGEW